MSSTNSQNTVVPQQFKCVAVVARRLRKKVVDTVLSVEKALGNLGIEVIFEDDTAGFLPANGAHRKVLPRAELPSVCDLVLVVGGDGSLLGVAREIAHTGVPVVGVNRGGLGFLAGISPDQMEDQLAAIFAGKYGSEDHFLLSGEVHRNDQVIASNTALNDVVVHPGDIAHMIEFELWVDDQYVYDQRSDGVIIASPTGSTAYSLSAGGPIMHPSLDAIVIVPMFPHTLTSRPLVVRGDANIRIKVLKARRTTPKVSWDSQLNATLEVGDEILIRKYSTPLKLLYPEGHDFFESCRSKLDWASRLGGSDAD